MQHPLEPAIQVKVQTKSDNPGPVQAVDHALSTLSKELDALESRFKKELNKLQFHTAQQTVQFPCLGEIQTGVDPFGCQSIICSSSLCRNMLITMRMIFSWNFQPVLDVN